MANSNIGNRWSIKKANVRVGPILNCRPIYTVPVSAVRTNGTVYQSQQFEQKHGKFQYWEPVVRVGLFDSQAVYPHKIQTRIVVNTVLELLTLFPLCPLSIDQYIVI